MEVHGTVHCTTLHESPLVSRGMCDWCFVLGPLHKVIFVILGQACLRLFCMLYRIHKDIELFYCEVLWMNTL